MADSRCIPEQLLPAFLEGELSEAESAEWESHLETCGECLERTRHLSDAQTMTDAVSKTGAVGLAGADVIVSPAVESLILRLSDRSRMEADVAASLAASSVDAPTVRPAPEMPTDVPPPRTLPATPAAEVPLGGRLGPYRILSKLGEGGMGAVYKATHIKLDKLVAVKVLSPQVTKQADAVARFEREMRAVGKLNHPHIVQAHDAGEIDGTHYLAMEYVDGNDLHKLVKDRGPMSVVNACKAIRQSALALAAAHGAGLVHRDIKPSNLLVAKNGQIKVLDLGLALLADDAQGVAELTTAGQAFGTPDYMAPEQWEDAHAADARTDLYALGCTLYFLLVGHPPYGTEQYRSAVGKMKAHVTAAIPNLLVARGDVPAELSAIYEKLLAKNPEDRFQTAAQLVEAITQFSSSKVPPPVVQAAAVAVAEAPATAPYETPPVLQSRTTDGNGKGWTPRKIALAAGGAAAMLLLGVIVITIINKDGTKTTINLQEGVNAKISAQPGTMVDITQADDDKPHPAATKTLIDPPQHAGDWTSLFDGATLDGWRGVEQNSLPPDWKVVDGTIVTNGSKTSIATVDEYGDFELEFEWKVAPGANGGVNYRWSGQTQPTSTDGLVIVAPEFQCVDNVGHPNGGVPTSTAGAVFGMYAPSADVSRPAGEWNQGRIVVRGAETEHWLNGQRVVAYTLESADWKERASKFALFASASPFGRGPIVLQSNTGVAEYRNLRLRTPAALSAATGWHGWPADAPKPAIAPFDAAQAKKHQEEWAAYLKVPVEYTNSIGMKFRLIPPGEFMMGATEEEVASVMDVPEQELAYIRTEAPQRHVVLTQPWYFGECELTQKQYSETMGQSCFDGLSALHRQQINWTEQGAEFPAIFLSWNDSALFCNQLSRREFLDQYYKKIPIESALTVRGVGYRLPTIAEFEYALRAGAATRYMTGDDPATLIPYAQLGTNLLRPIGERLANPFGLKDIVGNVCEWTQCARITTDNMPTLKTLIDPWICPNVGSLMNCCGSHKWIPIHAARSAFRLLNAPDFRSEDLGCRIVLPIEAVRKQIATTTSSSSTGSSGKAPLNKTSKGANQASTFTWHGWPADAPKPAIAPFDAAQAKKHQEEWAAYLKVPVEYTNSIGMKFRLIPPGEFLMGSSLEEIAALLTVRDERFSAQQAENWRTAIRAEGPCQPTRITKPFYLAVHEVTQAAYEKVIGKNPSYFSPIGAGKDAVVGVETGLHPVESLSWLECVEFCSQLSQQESLQPRYQRTNETVTPLTGSGYRLPSEAEWEMACRGGTTTPRWVGEGDDAALKAAWFDQNSSDQTHPVGKLLPNPFGLYDVLGNVSEYCEDGSDISTGPQGYTSEPAVDPYVHWVGRGLRLVRGGEYKWEAACSRSAFRNQLFPNAGISEAGFRVALDIEAVRKVLGTVPEAKDPGLAFDGVDDYIEIPRVSTRNDKPITVEAWLTPLTWKHSTIMYAAGKRPFSLYLYPNPDLQQDTVGFWCLGNKIELPVSRNMVGERIHVAGVYDNEFMTVYLNGQPSDKMKPLVQEGDDVLTAFVGAQHDWEKDFIPLRGFLHGQLHALRLSESVRYTGVFEPPASLEPDAETRLCYQFHEGEGDVVTDRSEHKYHGKIVGAKWSRGKVPSVNEPNSKP